MARVLVVEDEETVREFVCRALAMHGHIVLSAHDGAEAVQLLDAHHFDLLVSDIVMPMMDGISLALKVRASRPHVPIILMTGYANERQRAHNLSLLIEGLLTKPFTMDQLLAEVGSALKSSRMRMDQDADSDGAVRQSSPLSHSGISSSDNSSSSD